MANWFPIKHVIRLPNAFDYQSLPIARVANAVLPKLGKRHAWIIIRNGNRHTMCRVRGNGKAKGFSSDTIAIEYDISRRLCVSLKTVNMKMRKAHLIESLFGHLVYSKSEYKVPLSMAAIALIISLIGSIFTIIEFFT